MKIYLVRSKSDDYSACVTEVVETTPKLAKEYYSSTEVPEEDVEVLKKYIDFLGSEEEAERSNDERFYGNC